MARQRLDALMVARGLAASRERAKALIMAGQVVVDGRKVDKAGAMTPTEAVIALKGGDIGYVSRGGLKLAKALAVFGLDLAGAVVVDVGASTGGFTDCALQRGAARVYAIDVGYGQLAWKLRRDERVVNMERTNFRHVTPEMVPDAIECFSVDVSFISLKHIFPPLAAITTADAVRLRSRQAMPTLPSPERSEAK